VKTRRALRVLSWAGVLLVLVFTAVSVDARGGRGGGRGGGGRGGYGGGGFSRSGPASSGSFRTSRPSARPSYGGSAQRPSSYPSGARPAARPATRPATQPGQRPAAQPGQRPANQPGQQPARPGTTRPGAERPAQQPDRTGDREQSREDWQQHREDMQQDRQEYAKKAREDWQEYAEWDEGGGYWVGGWYGPVYHDDDVDDWVVFVSGLALGTALSSAAYSSMKTETKCTPTEVTVNQITYLKCGDNWYNRVMQGGQVNYVVVAPPPGF
jgi:hypothetical protein